MKAFILASVVLLAAQLSQFMGNNRVASAEVRSLLLDGVNDYAQSDTTVYPNSTSLQSFTVEAWVFPTRASIQVLASDDSYDLDLYFQSGASNGGLGIRFVLYRPGGSQTKTEFRDVQLNQWNHIAGQYDATTGEANIAINGVLSSSPLTFTGTSFVSGPTFNFVLGQSGFSSAYAKGNIDEVRVSDSVRYASDFTPSRTFNMDDDTKALFHFDEAAGSTSFTDASGTFSPLTGFNGAQIVATGTPDFLPADFNHDGVVDAADLAQWQGDFGVDAGSDANLDGNSDGADFLIWQQMLGDHSAPPSFSGIPEPASWLLCAICWTLLRGGTLVGIKLGLTRFV